MTSRRSPTKNHRKNPEIGSRQTMYMFVPTPIRADRTPQFQYISPIGCVDNIGPVTENGLLRNQRHEPQD
jgi:hypothetical protein